MKPIYVLSAALMLGALAPLSAAPASAQGGPNVTAPVMNDSARQNMDAAKKSADEERRRIQQQEEEAKKKAAQGQGK